MSAGQRGTWRGEADRVLAPLFAGGRQPTKQELFDAYPFGEREYFPYKAWCEQVRWWKAGCPQPSRAKKQEPIPEGQEMLF